jgi:hypothetical protein
MSSLSEALWVLLLGSLLGLELIGLIGLIGHRPSQPRAEQRQSESYSDYELTQ